MSIFGFNFNNVASGADFLNSRAINLVLDIGANRGQYASDIRKRGYRGRIHSFEPISEMYEQLKARASNDRSWQTFNLAMGAERGTTEINVTKNSVYSSIKEQSSMIADFSKKSAIVRKELIEVERLDNLNFDAEDRIFLKIDTQGFEREILLGGQATLSRCLGVQLELPAEHLYQGVWSFTEAVGFMDQMGFTPAQFRQVNPLHDDPVSAIEFDCIFRKKRFNS